MESVKKAESELWNVVEPYDMTPHKGLSLFKGIVFADEASFDKPTGEAMHKPSIESAHSFLQKYKPPEQRFRIPTKGCCSLVIVQFDTRLSIVCKKHKARLFNLAYDDAFDMETAVTFLEYCKYSTCEDITSIPRVQEYPHQDHID